MEAKNVTKEEMNKALKMVNKRFNGNVRWNRFEQKGNIIHFTLRVKSSKEPGHSRANNFFGKTGRRLVSACWHVHGYFFEALLKVNPNAVIISGMAGTTIDKDGGNWKDWDCGSIMFPQYKSEKCDCQ